MAQALSEEAFRKMHVRVGDDFWYIEFAPHLQTVEHAVITNFRKDENGNDEVELATEAKEDDRIFLADGEDHFREWWHLEDLTNKYHGVFTSKPEAEAHLAEWNKFYAGHPGIAAELTGLSEKALAGQICITTNSSICTWPDPELAIMREALYESIDHLW